MSRILPGAACLILLMFCGVSHASILTSHSKLVIGVSDADPDSPTFLSQNLATVESGSSSALSLFGSYDHGGIRIDTAAQAFVRPTAPSFMGIGASSHYEGTSSLFYGATSHPSAVWRDVAFLGGGNSHSYITLHFLINGELSEDGHLTGSSISVNTDTILRPNWALAGPQSSIQLFSDGSVQTAGWNQIFYANDPLNPNTIQFHGSVSIDAYYDAALDGYTWSIGMNGIAGASVASFETAASSQLSSLHSLGLDFVTDPDGNVLTDLTFDSGLELQVAAVPEPASLAIWGGIGLAGLVVAWRRKRSQSSKLAA